MLVWAGLFLVQMTLGQGRTIGLAASPYRPLVRLAPDPYASVRAAWLAPDPYESPAAGVAPDPRTKPRRARGAPALALDPYAGAGAALAAPASVLRSMSLPNQAPAVELRVRPPAVLAPSPYEVKRAPPLAPDPY